MRLGVWAPLPHTIVSEPEVERALDELGAPGVGLPVDRSFRFVSTIVRRADALGFDIALVAERLVARDLEAWIVASALAVMTSRIEIMTAVHPGIISPQVVAKMAVSLDRLSGGRCAINVVPGRRPDEFELFGNGGWLDEPEARYGRMDEFIAVMKGLWLNDPFRFDGRFFTVKSGRLETKPFRRPCPPVFAASGSDAGKDIIARSCDTWFVNHDPGLASYENNVSRIKTDIEDMRRRAKSHGRELGYGISAHVICRDESAEAEREAQALEANPGSNVAARALGAGLVGSARRIADRIRRYEDCGVDMLMLQFHPMSDGLERFAESVLPLIR
jgi:FMNH2-dependent dimethyl sulfone monooxygenase